MLAETAEHSSLILMYAQNATMPLHCVALRPMPAGSVSGRQTGVAVVTVSAVHAETATTTRAASCGGSRSRQHGVSEAADVSAAEGALPRWRRLGHPRRHLAVAAGAQPVAARLDGHAGQLIEANVAYLLLVIRVRIACIAADQRVQRSRHAGSASGTATVGAAPRGAAAVAEDEVKDAGRGQVAAAAAPVPVAAAARPAGARRCTVAWGARGRRRGAAGAWQRLQTGSAGAR